MTTASAMPPLDPAPPLSRFEFWPAHRFYAPIWLWIGWLALRYGGLRLPLLANPGLPAGGLVGESKSFVLGNMGAEARRWTAPHCTVVRSGNRANGDVQMALSNMAAAGLQLPIVAKPDLGCRGAGVRPVRNQAELHEYLSAFPAGQTVVLQKLVDVEGEAGVFYVRHPGQKTGRIFSLTLKHFPYVTGDGLSTLRMLIHADPRAGKLAHLYLPRHRNRLDTVVLRGETVRLAFAGSHSRGAIFRDGGKYITPELTARFDAIASDIPEFWFGRFDVRFADFEAFCGGRDFRIVEVNGAGSEATHIWDSRTRLRDAYRTLFQQFEHLWIIGAANRKRGFKPESWTSFFKRWQAERNLVAQYPPTA